MREKGLQARGAYKEVPRASRRLALEAPKSSKDVYLSKGQKVPLHNASGIYFLKILRRPKNRSN